VTAACDAWDRGDVAACGDLLKEALVLAADLRYC
jgi:hypothetical protein